MFCSSPVIDSMLCMDSRCALAPIKGAMPATGDTCVYIGLSVKRAYLAKVDASGEFL